jgi:hypothetical protein
MQVIDWTGVEFEQAFILSIVGIAEVVGSNPAQSTICSIPTLPLLWQDFERAIEDLLTKFRVLQRTKIAVLLTYLLTSQK